MRQSILREFSVDDMSYTFLLISPLCLGGAGMKLEPEEQDAVGWGDDEDLVIDEGKLRI